MALTQVTLRFDQASCHTDNNLLLGVQVIQRMKHGSLDLHEDRNNRVLDPFGRKIIKLQRRLFALVLVWIWGDIMKEVGFCHAANNLLRRDIDDGKIGSEHDGPFVGGAHTLKEWVYCVIVEMIVVGHSQTRLCNLKELAQAISSRVATADPLGYRKWRVVLARKRIAVQEVLVHEHVNTCSLLSFKGARLSIPMK